MHFGLYLVRKGVIDADQFVAALEQQVSEIVPLGQLAIEEGMLTMTDVFSVLRSQTDVPPYRFGEAAVNRGVMTTTQLAELLMVQSDRKRRLAEIFIEQGVLSKQEVLEEMSAFRRQCERGQIGLPMAKKKSEATAQLAAAGR